MIALQLPANSLFSPCSARDSELGDSELALISSGFRLSQLRIDPFDVRGPSGIVDASATLYSGVCDVSQRCLIMTEFGDVTRVSRDQAAHTFVSIDVFTALLFRYSRDLESHGVSSQVSFQRTSCFRSQMRRLRGQIRNQVCFAWYNVFEKLTCRYKASSG